MRKTRELFKKTIRNTTGIFHAKMDMMKERNSKDLTEKEEIKSRWQEYTEEISRKVLMTWIATMVLSLT